MVSCAMLENHKIVRDYYNKRLKNMVNWII